MEPNETAECPAAAIDAILEFEGIDQPNLWPGENSGVTIGVGYDLGYNSREQFKADWGGVLEPGHLTRLSGACGVTGAAARQLARTFSDIRISSGSAKQVFINATLPKERALTASIFPGIRKLPPMAQGMLVSLVYNRGSKMTGDSRLEMRIIRDQIASLSRNEIELPAAVRRIAAAISAMVRLWPNTRGLRERRVKEAQIVARSLQ